MKTKLIVLAFAAIGLLGLAGRMWSSLADTWFVLPYTPRIPMVYYPEVEVYYEPYHHIYYWPERGAWLFGAASAA